MKRKMLAGTTSVSLPIFISDTSSTTGGGLASLVYNSSGLTAKYRRYGESSWTTITLASATLGTYTSGGFVADNAGVSGTYEFCVPDAAVASGARWVAIHLYGATNMLPVLIEIELDAINYQDGVRAGLTALPNAAAAASGGLVTYGTSTGQINPSSGKVAATIAAGDIANSAITAASIASDAITDAKVASDVTIASVTGAVGSVTSGVTVTTNNDKTGYALSSAGVQAIWDALTSALTTVGSIGKLIVDNLNATVSSRLSSASYTAPDNTSITAIKAKTDNLPSDPADQSAVETAITTATSGLSTLTTSDIPTTSAIASAVWSAGTRTLTSFGTLIADIWSYLTSSAATTGSIGKRIADNLDAQVSSISAGSGATAAEVWDYLTADADTVGSMGKRIVDNLNATVSGITASVAATNPTGYTAGKITIQRGATVDRQLTSVTVIPADATKAILTVKQYMRDDDDSILLQIDSDDGLTILNGESVVDGSTATLTFDAGADTVDFHIDDDITAQLPISSKNGHYYDVKFFYPTGQSVITSVMQFSVLATVTEDV